MTLHLEDLEANSRNLKVRKLVRGEFPIAIAQMVVFSYRKVALDESPDHITHKVLHYTEF
jgi:hypothetical protein